MAHTSDLAHDQVNLRLNQAPPPQPEQAKPLPQPAPPPATLTGKVTGPAHYGVSLPHGISASLARGTLRASKDSNVELMLDPVELGKVRFDFSTNDGRIQINLTVERGETLELLRRHADQLRGELREAGFDCASFSFSQWSPHGKDNRLDATTFDDTDNGVLAVEPPDTQPNRNRTSIGHGLDLRL
jgi:flagellar hook-length control protein FliK